MIDKQIFKKRKAADNAYTQRTQDPTKRNYLTSQYIRKQIEKRKRTKHNEASTKTRNVDYEVNISDKSPDQ